MDPQRFDVLKSTLEDCRKLIAAAKVQRWDVFKWAIALITALGAALVSQGKSLPSQVNWSPWLVAGAAITLIGYYNQRARGARREADNIEDTLGYLTEEQRHFSPRSFWYDWVELLIFAIMLLVSSAYVTWIAVRVTH